MNNFRILVVDADRELCEMLRSNLEIEGFQVDVVYSAEAALELHLTDYVLLVLEVVTGTISGFKMVHIIRQNSELINIPIVFLTSKNTENDRLTGFNLGAEDYITKPFSLPELVARLRAITRRINATNPQRSDIAFENLRINLKNKQVLLEEKEVLFTRKEFEILKLLLENKNRTFTRSEILSLIWSEDAFVLNRTIDVNITRIRKKIGPYDKHIVTKLGLGYCFE